MELRQESGGSVVGTRDIVRIIEGNLASGNKRVLCHTNSMVWVKITFDASRRCQIVKMDRRTYNRPELSRARI